MVTQSWAPGHATLFFAVPETHNNPDKMNILGVLEVKFEKIDGELHPSI